MKDFLFETFPHMLHGGDYNPDRWQHRPDILKEDARLFRPAKKIRRFVVMECTPLASGLLQDLHLGYFEEKKEKKGRKSRWRGRNMSRMAGQWGVSDS